MDLTGINNHNEYYTNHYFSSIFEGNASDTISNWRIEAQGNEQIRTPWAKLKFISNIYAKGKDVISRTTSEVKKAEVVIDLANSFLEALSYEKSELLNVELNNAVSVPIYAEVKKNNGAPLLWILLSNSSDNDSDNLGEYCFDAKSVIDENLEYTHTDKKNEDLVSQIFFDTEEPPRWIILIGTNQICLLDRNKWSEKRFLEFDLDTIYQRKEDSTLQAMAVLLHKDSLCPDEGSPLLDEFNDESYRHAADVSKDLKYALRECIELLGNEVLYDMSHRLNRNFETDPVDAGELTIQCLRFMYRMLFLLFIEARPELGYAPIKNQTYFSGYSLESLRDIADSIREETSSVGDGYYLHETLSKLYDLIYEGYPNNDEELKRLQSDGTIHDVFVIEPLKAHIFDRAKTPMLRDSKIRNSIMLKIIDLMSLTRKGTRNTRRGRISYATLGINQLGAVYEALLSYRGFIAEETLFEVKREGDTFDELDVGYFVTESELNTYKEEERVRYGYGENEGKLRSYKKGTFIYRLAGREREKSASYYTPECLTKCLVKYALKELLKDKTADEILDLKVCEPAMGSAAFLNEAINQLSEAYIERKEKELGKNISYDKRWEEIQKVKMYIADNNVYGIDLNPTAVELAEVSLWLNTIYPGGYVPWFNTQLVNGNSLIGARKQCYNISKIKDGVVKADRWYNYAPDRVPIGEKRQPKTQIYHFLLGDPGMCDYNDKVIKELEKDNIQIIKNWRTKFCDTYSDENINTLLSLSSTIDKLFDQQVKLRKEVEEKTVDYLPIFDRDDNREISHTTIREKDEIFKKVYKSEHMENAGPYARLKFAMDYWCALWFWPIDKADMLPSRDEFLSELSFILDGGIYAVTKKGSGQLSLLSTGIQAMAEDMLRQFDTENGKVNLDELCEKLPRLQLVKEIADKNKFMHWELEFADIFAERGGFDLIVGNPPWLKLEWKEQDLLSDKNPLFAIRKLSASDTKDKRVDALKDIKTYTAYLDECSTILGTQMFLNAVQNYETLKGQQTNLFKCFLPQAWLFGNNDGISSFLHPDGVYDDPNASPLREVLYKKLKYHFHFINEQKLFEDVHHCTQFSLNVYSNTNKEIMFDSIANLFNPKTIDECYTQTGSTDLGIKDKNNNWNIKGDIERVIKINKQDLLIFAKLLSNSNNYKDAKLPAIQVKQLIKVLELFNQCETIGDSEDFYFSVMWDEANSQKDNTIKREVHIPSTLLETIYSGPHISVANPIFKASRKICNLNSDFDVLDLSSIGKDFIQRCNYNIATTIEKYTSKIYKINSSTLFTDNYRIAARKMLSITGERTLIPAIIPPHTAHINGIISYTSLDKRYIARLAGMSASIPFDFFIKMSGKSNMQEDLIGKLPLLDVPHIEAIAQRALMLNCLTKYYDKLWQDQYNEDFNKELWSKIDSRLDNNKFKNLTKEWKWETPLRTYYERRQALVEIDVLTSMALGMTFEQLKTIYQIQFPVLRMYEDDTWYDKKGRIVFTNNRGLTGVGLTRPEWETVKDYKDGQTVSQTIQDDTIPNGPVERTITYYAPFDKCNREEDYETAWAFFEEKYKEAEQ